MHVPEHASILPDHLDPIPIPDTKREAELLRFLPDADLYLQIQPKPRAAGTEESARGDPPTEK